MRRKMMTAVRNTTGTPAAGRKKPRKPYTISRPREKWTADEHDLFLHSLLMFGRDWKTIEQFVGTKTATQIRSHAQKYFLKAHKHGLAATLPPPHPRRAAVLLPQPPTTTSCFLDVAAAAASLMAPPAMSSPTAGAQQQSVGWPASCSASAAGAARWLSHDDSFMTTPNSSGEEAPAGGGGSPSEEEAWFADCLLRDGTVRLPLSPDDLRFADVYRFVGDVFGSGAARPIEAQLQRLHGVDPVVAETILLVLRNLQDNLCS